ncbi:hypothetical protein BJX64DRAFT_259611 [Aspergillus heterothallicus]
MIYLTNWWHRIKLRASPRNRSDSVSAREYYVGGLCGAEIYCILIFTGVWPLTSRIPSIEISRVSSWAIC